MIEDRTSEAVGDVAEREAAYSEDYVSLDTQGALVLRRAERTERRRAETSCASEVELGRTDAIACLICGVRHVASANSSSATYDSKSKVGLAGCTVVCNCTINAIIYVAFHALEGWA